LHAAGIYTGNTHREECAADYVVSSYTPSLSALIKSRQGFDPIPRNKIQALLVAEGNIPGFEPLHNVNEEARIISDLVTSSMGSVQLTSQIGACDTSGAALLERLSGIHALHLACHGHQAPDPLESSFMLRDGPLTIAALMRLDLPHAVLAFLSACETAKVDEARPEQAVHLAASMLFCGFRSVIATMWCVGLVTPYVPNIAEMPIKGDGRC
jgi:CHAT domain-containing protein